MNNKDCIVRQQNNLAFKKKIKKPKWIKVKIITDDYKINYMKSILRKNNLHSVCEEAQCPNLQECFNNGTVTFMILGAICTRKCPFCAVLKGRPLPPDENEPQKLTKMINKLKIKHIVLTSVTRDDLKDGGAQHFVKVIKKIRELKKNIIVEILVPDFKHCSELALSLLSTFTPDIFNHNLESVPRLYKIVRPGANYTRSLNLLKNFKQKNPKILTKSGIMLGLGETKEEIIDVIKDLSIHKVDMLTIGQYLQPSDMHLPVIRYLTPSEFLNIKKIALSFGFLNVFCSPFARSSYHADQQCSIQ
ncbi:lipoyl synthase [Buchnera aphidicola (Thelaxes californica)]|uniref:Lipoyl synthase n=1 Tax=Buchnera aphidicola (Thelaxes californica) TaxID=1315998 RepID=A0A4D6YF95_9GAMM|nr:lipoyl synthase [Buchnera aphidicola]QCI26743.1 lipoyl synthase [Buchnera aphidicola (Thelaxes californica)]